MRRAKLNVQIMRAFAGVQASGGFCRPYPTIVPQRANTHA
jgi:hypothetical protein